MSINKKKNSKSTRSKTRKNASKSTKKPTKRAGKKKAKKQAPIFSRVGKTLIFILLLTLVGVAVGSGYTQIRIKRILQEQALSSFAVVLSRPFALAPGVRPHAANITQRLKRLRYSIRNEKPQRPGQAYLTPSTIDLYLREFVSPSGQRQIAQRVFAQLDSSGRIQTLRTVDTNIDLPVAWLEPETLALLGSNESRATTPTTLAEISPWVPKALIAIEDERFYSHFGVDPIAILRALIINMKSGSIRQGGSTLTQQLAKNLFYGSEKTLTRKAKEAVAAILIETAFSKDQILELYLNEIFLGQEGRVAIHGFGEASLSFFGKQASNLDISEAATLVGIVKAPSYYSPRRHTQRARKRRDIVLGKMLEQGLLSEKQYLRAKDTPIQVKKKQTARRIAPYYVDYLRSVLRDAVPLDELSLQPIQIRSGIDVEYQRCAETAITQGINALEKRFPRLRKNTKGLQGALVSVTPATGEFLAWVGGRNYSKSQFERISSAVRQTGSVFKPMVYLTALDPGLNNYRIAKTTSILVDEPVRLEPVRGTIWEPQNYDKKFRGEVSLRHALVRSLNIPAVRLAQKVGIANIVRTTHRLGVSRKIPEVPAIALGAAELTPLEVARAYATIANGGTLTQFRPILSITKNSKTAKLLFQSPLRDSRRVSEAASFVLTDMLASAIDVGTGRSVRRTGYVGAAAGKTGTTNDARDAWFAGYTPHLLTVVWIGFDDNSKTGLTGGQAAAPIWSAYMQCVQEMEPKLEFIPPPGVVYRKVDTTTGMLASKNCDSSLVTTEIFVDGTQPTDECNEHTPGGFFAGRSKDESRRARINPKKSKPSSGGFLQSIIDNLWN